MVWDPRFKNANRCRWKFPQCNCHRSVPEPDGDFGPGPFCSQAIGTRAGTRRTQDCLAKKLSTGPKGIPQFRIYDSGPTYATRLSAGGVVDEWEHRCFDRRRASLQEFFAMKLQMKREATREAHRGERNGEPPTEACWQLHCARSRCNSPRLCTVRAQSTFLRSLIGASWKLL